MYSTLERLSDLKQQHLIYGVCNQCRRTTKLPCGYYLQVYGDLKITTLAAQLKCRRCGSRDCGIRIVWSP